MIKKVLLVTGRSSEVSRKTLQIRKKNTPNNLDSRIRSSTFAPAFERERQQSTWW